MNHSLSHFHRIQISKAQVFIRENLDRSFSLSELSRFAGVSKYHFIRVFAAYLGETPLEYTRRLRVLEAFKKLEDQGRAITEIALELGFDSPSSFNKAFKTISGTTPTNFRNLGKAQAAKLVQSITLTKKLEEIVMNLNLSDTFEVVERPETKIFALGTSGGRFTEIAPAIWQDFIGVLTKEAQDVSQSEFLGISFIEEGDRHIYKAAVSEPTGKKLSFSGLKEESLPPSKYAKFLLTGSYLGVWPSFDIAFKKVSEAGLSIAEAPCLENYINDPNITPEEELLTEILIPIK